MYTKFHFTSVPLNVKPYTHIHCTSLQKVCYLHWSRFQHDDKPLLPIGIQHQPRMYKVLIYDFTDLQV